jgi:hypothetical protein
MDETVSHAIFKLDTVEIISYNNFVWERIKIG